MLSLNFLVSEKKILLLLDFVDPFHSNNEVTVIQKKGRDLKDIGSSKSTVFFCPKGIVGNILG